GGIMILSSQLLANSDFFTGAFPAEYGNALSGVFDLRLRKGNNERKEYTVQAGLLGLDLAAEGPFGNGKRGSYLVNYRYSTLSMLSNLGVNIGDAVTDFQDLSFNVHMPTEKAGNFSVFGFGGLSGQNFEAKKDSSLWQHSWDRYSWNYISNTGAVGLKHGIILSKHAHLQSTIMASGNEISTTETRLDDEYQSHFNYENKFIQRKLTLNSVLNQKISSRLNMRSGFYINILNYGLKLRHLNDADIPTEFINDSGNTQSIQAFSQWNYRLNDKWSAVAGLHYHRLVLNGSQAVEPRASVQYQINDLQSVSFGYGLHSQVQPLGTYFAKPEDYTGNDFPNKNLELSKSHHYVLGYDRSLTRYLRIKLESYYQALFDIPVSADPEKNFSILNNQWGFPTEHLVSEGEGRNYGVEFTLEHFMYNGMYFLLSSSLYESHFKGQDGDWYNTRFNGNYNASFTAGKEFAMSKNRSLGINLRTIWLGGLRETPIDFEQSVLKGQTVYVESEAYTQKLPDYFRPDVRISLKRNRAKATYILALDVQNAMNRKNVFGKFYDVKSESIKTYYQLPLIPVLSYKIEFH
ncbi:MAG TPA: TonB-dependent receptor, partial [Cyclobacteriaceae bacterium]|nr:TonB-dependent receptor [Cyclobacteriaceae bacterium]